MAGPISVEEMQAQKNPFPPNQPRTPLSPEAMAQAKTMDPGQSSWKNYASGLANVPVDIGDGVEWWAKNASPYTARKLMPGYEEEAPPPEGSPEYMTNPIRSQLNDIALPALGIERPSTPRGEDQAMAGKNLAMAAPFLPLVGPVVGSLGVAAQLSAPFMARIAGEKYGEGAGLAADLAMAAAAPFAIETGGPRVAKALARTKLARYAKKTATPAIEKMRNVVNERLRERIGASFEDLSMAEVYEHAGDIKNLFPIDRDPTGQYDFIQEAIDQLDSAVQAFPNPHARPRSAQALGRELAGQKVTAWEEDIFNVQVMGEDSLNLVEGRNIALKREMENRYLELLPDGSPQEAVDLTRAYVDGVGDEATALWQGLDIRDLPDVDAAPFRASLEEMLALAGGVDGPAADLIPKFLRGYIENGVDSLTPQNIQTLRSRMLEYNRNVDLTSVNSGTTRKLVQTARRGIDEMIDNIPGPEGGKLAEARAATKKWKSLTDPDAPGVDAINQFMKETGAVEGVGKAVLKSEEGAQRMMDLMGHNPAAIESIKRAAVNEIVGDRFIVDLQMNLTDNAAGKFSPKQVTERIYKNAGKLKIILGEEATKGLIHFAKELDISQQLRVGRRGAVYGAGSNKAKTGVALGRAGLLERAVNVGEAGINKMLEAISSEPQAAAFLQEIALDPELMSTLLAVPVGRNKAQYAIEWKQAIARASARASANQGLADFATGAN